MSPEDIQEIYDELDLCEEGITEDEMIRRKTRIFVGGLKFASEDNVLHDHFSKFGDIKEAVVIRDRKTGQSKGYGFVTMHDEAHALKAIIDKSPKLDGRRCNVNLAYIGQKKKPPSKKPDMRLCDIPALTQHMCNFGGYPLSPTYVSTPSGHVYYLGLPPLHGHQPVYHIPSTPSPVFEPIENLPGHSPMSPMYPQPIFFSQPYIINNHLSAINNNVIPVTSAPFFPISTAEQNIDLNNNCCDVVTSMASLSINSSNNNVKVGTMPPKSPSNTVMSPQKAVTDPIVVTANSNNNNNVINYNNNVKAISEPKILISDTSTCTPQNGNVPLVNGRYVITNKAPVHLNNNPNIINNNTLMNTNMIDINGNTALMKPPAGAFVNNTSNHVINGTNHVTSDMQLSPASQHFPVDNVDTMIPCQSSVTTYISSPLPSPLIHPTNLPIYQFHPFIQTPKDIANAI